MSRSAADPGQSHEIEENAKVAYRLATNRTISRVHPWQSELFAKLVDSNSDAGYLLLTPTGSGKTEAVTLPSLGIQHGGAPRRLFVIAGDGTPLDDYVIRLGRYLKFWAVADGVPRTIYLDEDDGGPDGRAIRYTSDGAVESELSLNPLEADVDAVLTTVSRFLGLFFGSGGVHGLPSSVGFADEERFRRDMFFFDEAHVYSADRFSQFLKLVEYLFAQDTDIVVASSTMPAGFEEELSFMEKIVVPGHPLPVTLSYLPEDDALLTLVRQAASMTQGVSRVAIVTEGAAQAEEMQRMLDTAEVHTYRYLPGASASDRRKLYSELLDRDAKDHPYILLTIGSWLESSNLDVDAVLSTLCLPEQLILRAGRCNRRGKRSGGKLVVAGTSFGPSNRVMNNAQQSAYLAALRSSPSIPFDPDAWKTFI